MNQLIEQDAQVQILPPPKWQELISDERWLKAPYATQKEIAIRWANDVVKYEGLSQNDAESLFEQVSLRLTKDSPHIQSAENYIQSKLTELIPFYTSANKSPEPLISKILKETDQKFGTDFSNNEKIKRKISNLIELGKIQRLQEEKGGIKYEEKYAPETSTIDQLSILTQPTALGRLAQKAGLRVAQGKSFKSAISESLKELIDAFKRNIRLAKDVISFSTNPDEAGYIQKGMEDFIVSLADFSRLINENPELEQWTSQVKEYTQYQEQAEPKNKTFYEKSVSGASGMIPGLLPALMPVVGIPVSATIFFGQGAGDLYSKMVDDLGIDRNIAVPVALAGGAVYAAIEQMQIGRILKPIKKFKWATGVLSGLDDYIRKTPLAKSFFSSSSALAKKINNDLLNRLVSKPIVRNVLNGTIQFGKDVTVETLEEVAQDVSNAFFEDLGAVAQDYFYHGVSPEYNEQFSKKKITFEKIDEFVNTAKETIGPMLVLGITNTLIGGGLKSISLPKLKPQQTLNDKVKEKVAENLNPELNQQKIDSIIQNQSTEQLNKSPTEQQTQQIERIIPPVENVSEETEKALEIIEQAEFKRLSKKFGFDEKEISLEDIGILQELEDMEKLLDTEPGTLFRSVIAKAKENGITFRDAAEDILEYKEEFEDLSEREQKLNEELKLKQQSLFIEPTPENYFEAPDQDRELKPIPESFLREIGKTHKPLVLKKNIVEKNRQNHPDLTLKDNIEILSSIPKSTVIIQNYPREKPNNYVFVTENGKSKQVLIELEENKDHFEIVNWHYIGDRQLKQKIQSAEKNGGRIIRLGGRPSSPITSVDINKGAAGRLSALQPESNNIIPQKTLQIKSENKKPQSDISIDADEKLRIKHKKILSQQVRTEDGRVLPFADHIQELFDQGYVPSKVGIGLTNDNDRTVLPVSKPAYDYAVDYFKAKAQFAKIAESERKLSKARFLTKEQAQKKNPEIKPEVIDFLSKFLGVRIYFFEGAKDFNGLTNTKANYVYVNIHSDKPVLAIIGHEWLHQLKANSRTLYYRLVESIKNNPRFKEYQDRYAERARDLDLKLSEADLAEEAVADFVSDNFGDESFWTELAQRDKLSARKILKHFINLLNRILSAIKLKYKTVDDLKSFRNLLQNILSQKMTSNDVKIDEVNKTIRASLTSNIKKENTGLPEKIEESQKSLLNKKFIDVVSHIPADRTQPVFMESSYSNDKEKILREAKEVFNAFPNYVIAADGKKILIKNPDVGEFKDKLNNRILRLITSDDRKTLDSKKAKYLPNILTTLKEASIKLIDPDTQNYVYYKKYSNNHGHSVVVSHNNLVVGQEIYDHGLITQFPEGHKSRRLSFDIAWIRETLMEALAGSKVDKETNRQDDAPLSNSQDNLTISKVKLKTKENPQNLKYALAGGKRTIRPDQLPDVLEEANTLTHISTLTKASKAKRISDPYYEADKRGDFNAIQKIILEATPQNKYEEWFIKYVKAKKLGDIKSADEIVSQFYKNAHEAFNKLKNVLNKNKKTIFIPVLNAEEPSVQLNQLPIAYAKYLANTFGGEVYYDIRKIKGKANTGVSKVERFNKAIEYAGSIRDKNAQYVIVDDTYTQGGTIYALIEHLLKQGADVKQVMTIAHSMQGKKIKNNKLLLEKFQRRVKLSDEEIKRLSGYEKEWFTGAELYSFILHPREFRRFFTGELRSGDGSDLQSGERSGRMVTEENRRWHESSQQGNRQNEEIPGKGQLPELKYSISEKSNKEDKSSYQKGFKEGKKEAEKQIRLKRQARSLATDIIRNIRFRTVSTLVNVPRVPQTASSLKDPILRRFVEDIKEKQIKIVESKVGTTIKPNEFLDIDQAMHKLQMETGYPYYDLQQQIEFQLNQNEADTEADIKGVFAGTKWENNELDFINSPSEARVTYYIINGKTPDNSPITEDERKVAERIDALYQKWEKLVKRIRFVRYLQTGKLPISEKASPAKKAELIQLLNEGAEVLVKDGIKAWDAWLDTANFGIRKDYLPFVSEYISSRKMVRAKKFGRGFTMTRETLEDLPPNWENDYPLIGALYRYVKRARNIESVEPYVEQLDELFSNYKGDAKLDRGILDRYFDNIFGTQDPMGDIEKAFTFGIGHFFRVNIPQNIIKWTIRNLPQNIAMTLPLVLDIRSRKFWEGIGELFAGLWRLNESKYGKHFLLDKDVREWFFKHVAALESAQKEYLLNEMSKWEAKGGGWLHKFMTYYDSIGKIYSFSDTINRMNAFNYIYNVSKKILNDYQSNPSEKIFNEFLSVTGAWAFPELEQARIADLIDKGKYEEAARMTAKYTTEMTQFNYKRIKKALAWQRVSSFANLAFPIATFSKGSAILVYRAGFKPLIEFIRAYQTGNIDTVTRLKAIKAVQFFIAWYLSALILNKLLALLFDIDDEDYASYGVSTLKYVPGGPIIQNVIRTLDEFWKLTNNEKGAIAKFALAAHALGEITLPGYRLGNRIIGRIKGQEYYKLPVEIQRSIREILDKNYQAPRKWTNRDLLQTAQYLVGMGSWPAKKEDIIEAYAEYLDATSQEEAKRLQIKVEKLLRKYPVSTKLKEIPRTIENIGEFISEADPDHQQRAVELHQKYLATNNLVTKAKLRKQIERILEKIPKPKSLSGQDAKLENIKLIIPDYNAYLSKIESEQKPRKTRRRNVN